MKVGRICEICHSRK